MSNTHEYEIDLRDAGANFNEWYSLIDAVAYTGVIETGTPKVIRAILRDQDLDYLKKRVPSLEFVLIL